MNHLAHNTEKVEFFLNNEDVLECLNKIGQANSTLIKRKLHSKNSKDYLNLLAVIDELYVGSFLSDFGSVKYDYNIFEKTPDWFIKKSNTIVEVRGINQIKRDLERDNFETKIYNHIQSIKGTYFVSIRYNSEEEISFFTSFSFEDFITKFSVWFSENRQIGDIFEYNKVQIEIFEENCDLKYLEVGIGNLNFIHIDKRKLKNIIDEKLDNYKEIILKTNSEFIIAIVSDMKNGIREDDLKMMLYGQSIFNKITNTRYSILNGLYYEDEYKKYISGILFLIRGKKPKFLKNYSNKNNGISNMIEKNLTQQLI